MSHDEMEKVVRAEQWPRIFKELGGGQTRGHVAEDIKAGRKKSIK